MATSRAASSSAREDFQRFDTDGDDLIDSKEAAGMP